MGTFIVRIDVRRLIVFIYFSLSSLFAIKSYTYDEAIQLQKQIKKVILIDVIHKDCRFCIKMGKNFNDAKMSKWLEDKFIFVKIDIDNEKLPFDVEIPFTPTFLFVKDGKIIKIIPGYWDNDDFKYLTKGIK